MDDCLLWACIPDRHPPRLTNTKCRIHKVIYPDDGTQLPDTVEKINISRNIVHKFGLIYSIIQGWLVNRIEKLVIFDLWSAALQPQFIPYSGLQYFSTLSLNSLDFLKKHYLLQNVFWFSLQHFSDAFFINKNRRATISQKFQPVFLSKSRFCSQIYMKLRFQICQHLIQHRDVTGNNVRNVCHENVMSVTYKSQQGSHYETVEKWDSRLLKWVCGAVGRKPAYLWFCVICWWGYLHWHVDIHEQNGTFCASQQLLFLLTNEMSCREVSVQYC